MEWYCELKKVEKQCIKLGRIGGSQNQESFLIELTCFESVDSRKFEPSFKSSKDLLRLIGARMTVNPFPILNVLYHLFKKSIYID